MSRWPKCLKTKKKEKSYWSTFLFNQLQEYLKAPFKTLIGSKKQIKGDSRMMPNDP